MRGRRPPRIAPRQHRHQLRRSAVSLVSIQRVDRSIRCSP